MGIKLDTIFELLKNYDKYGFELLYEHYFRLMYGIAFSVCKDDEISKDAIQNAMIILYKLDPKKFPNNNELSWLYKVVKNETLQLLRKQKNKLSIDEIADLPMIDKSIENIVDIDSYNYLIKDLNEEQKRIITLKVICGLTHKEIAKVLSMPSGTVMWVYNTSIKRLKVVLGSLMSIIIIVGISFISKINAVPNLRYVKEESYMMDNLMAAKAMPLEAVDWRIKYYVIGAILLISLMILFINGDKIPIRFLTKKTK